MMLAMMSTMTRNAASRRIIMASTSMTLRPIVTVQRIGHDERRVHVYDGNLSATRVEPFRHAPNLCAPVARHERFPVNEQEEAMRGDAPLPAAEVGV